MSAFFSASHRRLQDEHGTRALADRLEAHARASFEPPDRDLIQAATMVFVSTVDGSGQPTVSYKGGAPGFIRVTGPNELIFPSYDGNGMFLSLGNLGENPRIGLLFIDFEHPNRLRVHGRAALADDPALLGLYPGADHVVRVTAEQIFVNCGRYIHQSGGATLSPHLPDASGQQPFPAWKRIDIFAGALPEGDDREVARKGGTIPLDAYRGEADPA
ncbi:pyridoxamine 5'-phosphate oxidase family protein [Methylobacterium aquaticum]|uniref:pyridoxamine 5'-phosphate oxidase family protein n=1 Tax=Methylobacterium aquaticum TaxID=270351 RepID=UPI0019322643|nr:pyridoxamine 5'-phosphate oxidase family protein [Methylobacterium aquaticum]QRE73242.1 pyridoxamine 5'-phosphate oxidase family protein [Methylobacterium aquaticum]